MVASYISAVLCSVIASFIDVLSLTVQCRPCSFGEALHILGKSPLILAKMLLYFWECKINITRIPYIRDSVTRSSFKISVYKGVFIGIYLSNNESDFIFCVFDNLVGIFSLFLVCHVVPVSVL